MEPSSAATDVFLEKLNQEVERNLTNDQFGVEELCKSLGMSRSQLHRKLNGATGQSITQFIREFRLNRSMEYLQAGDLTAAEVADRVGFNSATYFSKCFTEFFGFPPGEARGRSSIPPVPINRDNSLTTSEERRKPNPIQFTIAGILMLAIAFVSYVYLSDAPNESVDKSIAILPFRNLTEDPRNLYFSEGVAEAVRTGLSQIGDIRVISHTSVEQYRESNKSAQEIADELGVSALLEGSIQRDNDRVRLDVRMVNGRTSEAIWAASFDRQLKDVFAIQNEIARHVASELNAKLSAAETSRLSRPDTENPKAYDLYLKAQYEYRTYTNRGAHNAIELLTQAIQLDPRYARAYAALASSYIGLATIWGAELSALEALEKGKPFIDQALQLDPGLDEAHTLSGFYKLYHDWDFAGAESEYKLGITYDQPDALAVYVDYLNFAGRHTEATEFAERLNELDPYYPNSRMVLSYFYSHRFEEAEEFSRQRLKVFNNYNSLDSHGFLLLNTKRYGEAVIYFQKAMALEGIRYPRMLGWMGAAFAKDGKDNEARKIIGELTDRLKNNDKGSIAFFIAVIHAALGEKTLALDWLDRSHADHEMEMPWLMTEPQFYVLHDEPRFKKLALQMRFPQLLP